MILNIAWSGLSDFNYWNHIAKYCVPSWQELPGDKFLICDNAELSVPNINIVPWDTVVDPDAKFPKIHSRGRKQTNFWRKMQSQVWAINNLKNYDWLVLLDTDIEVYQLNLESIYNIITQLSEKNLLWATGESQDGFLDAGVIIINTAHPELDKFTEVYKDFWESGKIKSLEHGYDGDVVVEMLKMYESLKIRNFNHGQGMHSYNFGLFHWGSKESKPIRRELDNSLGYIKNKINSII
jgi:hypothetical protein